MNPMIPCLTGYLIGCIDSHDMLIRKVHLEPPDRFTITFGSGLVVEVKVTEQEPEPE